MQDEFATRTPKSLLGLSGPDTGLQGHALWRDLLLQLPSFLQAGPPQQQTPGSERQHFQVLGRRRALRDHRGDPEELQEVQV